jgi:glycosyltransferase involved in cell wall biosynthesis
VPSISQHIVRDPHSNSPELLPLRWIVSQEGTRQTYAIPLAFHRLGVLRKFYADIWCRRGRSLLRHGPAGARALATHFNPEIPPELVVDFNPAAILDRIALSLRRGNASPAELAGRYCRYGEWFANQVRNHLERQELDPDLDCFFGFNTNCLETLGTLRQRKILTVVDQIDPGVIEEDMVIAECERWPGWAKAPGRMPKSYWDRIRAEWELADLVLVNSEWSLEALVQQGVPRQKLIVVPLAIDLQHEHRFEPVQAKGILKVLWLGSVILRKGIPYLVEAARKLQDKNIEFLLAGPLGVSPKVVEAFPSNMKWLGRVTRDQLSGIYAQAQVFVLPTVSDGFAITQLEAMGHGLPVVTTPNCGRVVTDGVDGFIVPARDSQALADALAKFNDDRKLLQAMSNNALETVKNFDLPSNAKLINMLALMHRQSMQDVASSAPFPATR